MYTRCPSCRAEISFEPPANAASLPEGYKHKIKCPSCGVTIGVKIPRVDSDIQPTFVPQNPYASSSEPVFQAEQTQTSKKSKAKKSTKARGRGANIVFMILSLLLVVISVLGYFVNKGSINVELLNSLAFFDGISPIETLIKDFEAFKTTFAGGMETMYFAMLAFVPTALFLLAAINTIVAIIACAVGKYSRVYNIIISWVLFGCATSSVLMGFLSMVMGGEEGAQNILGFVKGLFESKQYFIFVTIGISLIQSILSFCFIGIRKKKAE